MARPLCWYKNIKPGDVLEVKFLPGHCFFRPSEPEAVHEVKMDWIPDITYFSGMFLSGRFHYPDAVGGSCIADFSEINYATPEIFNQVRFLRKIKQDAKK